jgi:hypothetical protein
MDLPPLDGLVEVMAAMTGVVAGRSGARRQSGGDAVSY